MIKEMHAGGDVQLRTEDDIREGLTSKKKGKWGGWGEKKTECVQLMRTLIG